MTSFKESIQDYLHYFNRRPEEVKNKAILEAIEELKKLDLDRRLTTLFVRVSTWPLGSESNNERFHSLSNKWMEPEDVVNNVKSFEYVFSNVPELSKIFSLEGSKIVFNSSLEDEEKDEILTLIIEGLPPKWSEVHVYYHRKKDNQ